MSIEMEELPRNMSLSELADRCMSEINRYRRGEASSDQYCLEIFRRAMLEHEDAAWVFLERRFRAAMLGWFHKHPNRDVACLHDSPENYINLALERFWMATVHNQKLEFTSLAAALSYLRSSLNGAIVDTLRMYGRSEVVALPEPDLVDEQAKEERPESYELWELVRKIITNEREWLLAHLHFYCGLKPREIVRYYAQDFPDVQEVYRLLRNILEKLRRHRDQFRWWISDDEA